MVQFENLALILKLGFNKDVGFERARLQPCRKHRIFIAALQFAEKLGFVSGHRFSDAASPAKSDAPSGAGCRNLTFHKLFSC